MANQNGRPVAPARKLVAAVVGTIAVFVMLFGLGMSSWAIVALGLAMLILAVALGMVNVVRRGARAWVAGTAQVKSVSEPPATAIYGRAELQIVIVAPGLPTSEVTVRDPRVPVVKWPRVGDTLPVTVDVDDMRRVRINWDEAETYEQTTQNVPPTYYDEDLPDDDLLGGEPEPPPWAARDRQWGRGPDEPPPPPPSPRTGDLDGPPPPPPRAGLLDEPPPPVIVRDSPGGPIVEGQLVEPDYEYSSPLPQRARTATAPPPRPAADKPRPRPRPHATATLDPEAEVAEEDEQAAPAPAQRTPQEPVTAPDPDIDLSLDADPESTPAARAAVQDDIIAKPAFSGPDQADEEVAEPDSRPSEPSTDNRAARVLDAENGPRQRSADDDLLGDLEPPPWKVRAQQPTPEPDPVTTASPAPGPDVDPGPDPDLDLDLDPGPDTGGSPARGGAAGGGAAGGDAGSASGRDASRPAAESRPRPRGARPDDAPRAEGSVPDTGEQPKSAAPTPGLAAAAGAVVAAGIAAFGNALRGKKHEERRAPQEGPAPAAQRPEAPGPTGIDTEPPATAATGRDSTGDPGPNTAGESKSNVGLGAVSATRSGPGPDRAPAPGPGPAAPAAGPTAAAASPTAAATGPAAGSTAAAAGPTAAAATAARPAASAAGPAAPAADAVPVGESDSARAAGSPIVIGQVYASPTAFGPGGGSGKGNLAEAKPRPEPTPIRPATVYTAGPVPEASPPTTSRSHTAPLPEPATAGGRRGKPWADLEGGFEPDDRADDVITAYPSARPGPAGAIHGVGITVLVTNLERSVAFYREMLGFYEIDTGSGSAVLASGDTRLVLRTVHDLSNAAGRLIYLNLEVGDVEAIYEELKRKGVKFVHGPRPVNRGDKLELWAASFHDPDQHNIAITQWRAIR